MARTNMQGFESRGLAAIGVYAVGGGSVTIDSPGYLGIGYQLSMVSGSGSPSDARGTYVLRSHVQAAELYIRMMLAIARGQSIGGTAQLGATWAVSGGLLPMTPGTDSRFVKQSLRRRST